MECFLRQIGQGGSCPMCRGDLPAATALVVRQEQQQQRQQQDRLLNLRYEARQRRKHDSTMRRTGYLAAKKQEWSMHCTTCKTDTCIALHDRKTQWLERGHLMPCPPKLCTESKMFIGFLLCSPRAHWRKAEQLSSMLFRPVFQPSSISLGRRRAGLLSAIAAQEDEAKRKQAIRDESKGSVVLRLGCNVNDYIEKPWLSRYRVFSQPTAGCKVFKGFMPPKKGARTGDFWLKDHEKSLCIGFHLWLKPDGTKLRLQKGKWLLAQKKPQKIEMSSNLH